MKELTGLIWFLRILGWFWIIGGMLLLALIIITPDLLSKYLPGLGGMWIVVAISVLSISSGILCLVIASGLSKKKKWAWYLGVIVFIWGAIEGFLSMTLGSIVVGIFAIAFLIVLSKERKAFFEKPESPSGAS